MTQVAEVPFALAAIDTDGRVDSEQVARLLAELDGQRATIAALQDAAGTDRTIGTALGLIMSANGITLGSAYSYLNRLSQREQRDLTELAAILVHRHCAQARSLQRNARVESRITL